MRRGRNRPVSACRLLDGADIGPLPNRRRSEIKKRAAQAAR